MQLYVLGEIYESQTSHVDFFICIIGLAYSVEVYVRHLVFKFQNTLSVVAMMKVYYVCLIDSIECKYKN